MSSTLGPPGKNKEPKNPRNNNAEILAGAAATATGAGADRTNGQGRGRGGGGGREGMFGRRKRPTIIRTDARLKGENMLEVALSV